MAKKETSNELSRLAAQTLSDPAATARERRLAASVLAQDETKGFRVSNQVELVHHPVIEVRKVAWDTSRVSPGDGMLEEVRPAPGPVTVLEETSQLVVSHTLEPVAETVRDPLRRPAGWWQGYWAGLWRRQG